MSTSKIKDLEHGNRKVIFGNNMGTISGSEGTLKTFWSDQGLIKSISYRLTGF